MGGVTCYVALNCQNKGKSLYGRAESYIGRQDPKLE